MRIVGLYILDEGRTLESAEGESDVRRRSFAIFCDGEFHLLKDGEHTAIKTITAAHIRLFDLGPLHLALWSDEPLIFNTAGDSWVGEK